MIQAIIPFFLAFLSLGFLSNLFAESLDCQKTEFYLSRAYQDQAEAFQTQALRRREESQNLFQSSNSFFQAYHTCLEVQSEKPSQLSAYATAVNFGEMGDLVSASKWVEVAYTSQKPMRDTILLKAKIEMKKGEALQAIETLESNLSLFPTDSDFLYLLGNVSNEVKNGNKAILYFTSLYDQIMRRDGNPRYKNIALKSLGELHFKANQPKKALFYYQAYIMANPNDLEANYRVSQIYYFLGDFASSKRHLLFLREKNPRDIESMHLLAEMFFLDSRTMSNAYFDLLEKEGKIPKTGIIRYLYQLLNGDKANLSLELLAFLEKNPNRLSARVAYQESLSDKTSKLARFQAYVSTAELAFAYRQFWVAKEALEKAIQVSKDDPALAIDIPVLLERISRCDEELGKPNLAILRVQEGLEKSLGKPLEPNLRYRLAYLYLNESIKKWALARKETDTLIKQFPENPQYHFLSGLVDFQSQKYTTSVQAFDKAIQLEPKNANHYFYRALAYDKLGNFPQVEADLEKAMELSPDSPNAFNYLGYLYTEKNTKLETAKSLIQKAVQLEPDNGAYQDSLGWVFYNLGQLEEANLHLKLAEVLTQDKGMEDHVIYDHIGDVYLKKADRINAVAYWEKSKKLSKSSDEIAKLQRKIDEANEWLQK